MLATCMLTVIWWAQWLVCSRSAAKYVRYRAESRRSALSLAVWLANRPESALAVTLARQDAEYPVDAQLKAALTQPLNALVGMGSKRPVNCRRYVRNMASWRRQEHNDCWG